MKNKKILSAVISMVMLFITAQGLFGTVVSASNVVSSGSDGVFWIEESDYDSYVQAGAGVLSGKVGTNGTVAADTTDLVSGGDAYYAYWSGQTYSATYKINAPSAGTYKLWYRGSDPTNAYYDKVKLKVNGTDKTSSLSKVTGTDFTVKIEPSGTVKNFACAYFLTEVTLVSGENTIVYDITEKSTTGAKYAGLFDCVVIAPSTYEWKSPTKDNRPEEVIDTTIYFDSLTGVAKFEESDYDSIDVNGKGVLSGKVGTNGTVAADTTELVSGGDAYYAYWGGQTYSATYKVNAPSAGTYKLWYSGSDPTNAYYDKVKLKVNDVDITSSLTKVTGTDFTVKIEPSGTVKNFACAYFLTEVTLVSGENTIVYDITEKSTTGAKYAGLFDCVVIAPSNYEWASPKKDTFPAEVIDTTIYFDSLTGVAKFEESNYDSIDANGKGVLSGKVGTNGTVAADTTELVSGGDAYYAYWGGQTYSATYKVNAPSAGTYKLWYSGSDPTNAYHDKSKLKVNGVDITSSLSKVTGTDFTVKIEPSGTPKNFACAFFLTEVTLVSGENTIVYDITEKSTTGAKYAGLFDCVVIAPSTYEWAEPTKESVPTQIQLSKHAWIEGENYTLVNDKSKFQSRTFNTDVMSQGKALVISTQSAPSDSYYVEYTLSVAATGTYDVLVRTNHTSGGDNNSPVIISIDGAVQSPTELDFEGWLDPVSGSDKFTVGWSKITLQLTAGVHTLRWAINTPTSTRYFGIVDAVVFIPSSMNFTPQTNDIVATREEYELSALLADYDLTSVSGNLTLPQTTDSGKAVTWTTSDSGVITNTGVITCDEYYTKTAILTASITGYSKNFTVRVPNMNAYTVENFNITGTMGSGNVITVSADVTSSIADKSMVLILAQYNSADILKEYAFNKYTLTQNTPVSASASITLADYTAGDYVRAYLWNNLDEIIPIADSIAK